jgi:TolB-like protein/DNA-binding winged helix-turn-helix (wHTH) protein
MKRRSGDVVEFAPFSFDLVSRELRKDGRKLKLHPQPARVLELLLRKPGEIARRDDIQKELWHGDTYVSFDLSINSCIRQIRRVLGDEAQEPRFVQTVAREGYRFIAPLTVPSAEEQGTPPRARLSLKRYLPGVLAAAVIAALAFAGWRSTSGRRAAPPEIDSIAVLPLENLSGNPEEEYFADGMTEALIAELAKIGALKVISRTTVMHYKNAEKSLPEMGRELDVDAIVEGSVFKVDERVRSRCSSSKRVATATYGRTATIGTCATSCRYSERSRSRSRVRSR